MQSAGTGHDARALPGRRDEEAACGCAARLLISAATERGAEAVARRIHGAGPRAPRPFVHLWARDFPVEPRALQQYCGTVLDRAAGGSLLIDKVEEMAPAVQDMLIEVLAALQLTRGPSAPARLIAGTTVSLPDRIAAGTFSGRLFYRLNTIHLVAPDDPRLTGPDDGPEVHVEEGSAAKRSR